jgi:hypothetical protein
VSVVSVSWILVTVCADSLKASLFVLRISLLTLTIGTDNSSDTDNCLNSLRLRFNIGGWQNPFSGQDALQVENGKALT